MGIASLHKTKANTIMGLDVSTTSIAFSIFDKFGIKTFGKIHLHGSDIYEISGDANRKIKILKDFYNVDYTTIEAAVHVKNIQVAIKLAYVFGSIIGELKSSNINIIAVSPLTWQTSINNPPLTKTEKQEIIKNYPGKSKTWYSNKGREIRKQKTIDYFNIKYGLHITDNDVADACGIGEYTYKQLTRRE
jgi:Holliday junction resolvasome RuvABC endonuclease subunit